MLGVGCAGGCPAGGQDLLVLQRRLICAGCPHPHWQQWDGLSVPKPVAVSDSDAAHSSQGVARGTPKPPLPWSKRKGNLESRADLLLTGVQVLLLAEKGENPVVWTCIHSSPLLVSFVVCSQGGTQPSVLEHV